MKNFHWRAIAGEWRSQLGGGTPRNFGPCGTVLDRNTALLFSHPERDFPYFGEVKPLLEEGLLIPFYINGEAVGTIWIVSHDGSRRFDLEDLRVMTSLATFSAAAYQTVRTLHASIRTNRELHQSASAMQQLPRVSPPPTTPSLARISTASSAAGTEAPSGCSAIPRRR